MKKKLTFRGKVRKIYAMIKDPSRHCIKVYFRDRNGEETPSINAYSYCLVGASMKIRIDNNNSADDRPFYRKLGHMIGTASLSVWNDTTPHSEIIETLRKIGWDTTESYT